MRRLNVLAFVWLAVATAFIALAVAPAHAGPGGGTYFANSPAGGSSGTAIRKFVDSLPGLGAANPNNRGQYIPLANPDTTTYAGSDYYVIGLRDYTQQLHSDLPKATKLRGYYQVNTGTTGTTDNTSKYLGPVILATKDRPVRILFQNNLPRSNQAGSNLFLPVDTTAMGAGMGPKFANGTDCDPLTQACALFTQNRATLHLHGGNTPWISDGTDGPPVDYPRGRPVPLQEGPEFPERTRHGRRGQVDPGTGRG